MTWWTDVWYCTCVETCINCGKSFDRHHPKQKYCTRACKCKAAGKRKWQKLLAERPVRQTCIVCFEAFGAPNDSYVICSKECRKKYFESRRKYLDIPACIAGSHRKLDKNIGYVRLYAPMHPEANTWGYVYEHRIIAEQMIGRRLRKGEIVHHKNGKRWDNRPENLEVMDRREHARLAGQRKEDLDI